MANKKSSEYNLQTNMGPNPNSQGTLFSGGPRTPPSHRGYTPERLAETRAQFTPLGNAFKAHLQANNPGSYEHAYDRVMQTYARSAIDFTGQPKVGLSFSPSKEGYHGGYKHKGATKHGMPEINLPGTDINNYIPVHEYGHHDDRVNVSNLRYQDDIQRGRGEGYADQYAQNSYRTPSGVGRGSGGIGRGGEAVTIGHRPQGWNAGYGIDTPSRQQNFGAGYASGRAELAPQTDSPAPDLWSQPGLF